MEHKDDKSNEVKEMYVWTCRRCRCICSRSVNICPKCGTRNDEVEDDDRP